jgi:hypothetical protein
MDKQTKQNKLLDAFVSGEITIGNLTLKKPTGGTLALMEKLDHLSTQSELNALGVYAYIHSRSLKDAYKVTRSKDDYWLYDFLDGLSIADFEALGAAVNQHNEELQESVVERVENDDESSGGK